ncbi:MAG: glycoside hydrolase family 3 C-terminal domain-containing protein [Prolixibacteraceae bacterium]|nr:glycoside hydrolase family 3 C-terminal domain-containing protein [Prolixibacteraceae bacterium]
MKQKLILLCLFSLIQFSLFAQNGIIIYKQKDAPIEARIKDLMSKMTLKEKILQLNQYIGGYNNNANNIAELIRTIPPEIGSLIYFDADPVWRNSIQKKAMEESRLGIPILFGFDVIHGYRTVYPVSLAQACSWNPELVTQAAAIAAKEAKLSGIDLAFSPMLDVARDGRWGRVTEGYGEDPYTNAVFGVATVKGYQGKDLSDPYSIAACLKHYVGYSRSEGGRDYHSSEISRQSLWETYLVPFEACVKAGAASVMSAFNDISGVPASANHYTLTQVLKDQWKFDGFVVSDWGALTKLIAQGVAKDKKEAGLKAFNAGVDMDMYDNIYFEYLEELLNEKKISMVKIDDAVSRVLRVKFRLGLFDNPYTEIVSEHDRYLHPESKIIAQKLAAESMVLLKNNSKTLPIKSSVKQIALIGPIAKDTANIIGGWEGHGKSADVESIYEGMVKEFGKNVVLNYAKGCDFDSTDESGFREAVLAAAKSDLILVCVGEKLRWTGENASRSTLALPAIQEKLVFELKKTGKPIVLILSNGRPIELIRLEPQVDAIVEMWQPGICGGTALAQILSGKINPSGKLSITFPLTTGQIPIYYDMRQSGEPNSGKYQDIPTDPQYWFGHGLSYTTFEYGAIKLSSEKIKKTEKLIAQVEVSNTGDVAGRETVLWYISDPACSISRPMKELKYFEKKELARGEKLVFRFEIDPERDLSYTDENGNRILESGDFYVIINNQKTKFEIIE